MHGARQLAAAVLPPVLVLLSLLVATGSPRALATGPWLLLFWLAVASAAALYRPFGVAAPSLGLGTIAMAPLLAAGDTAGAAMIAGLAVILAEIGHRAVENALGGGDDRPMAPTFERAMVSVLAVLVTAALAKPLAPMLPAAVGVVVTPLFYAMTLFLASAGLDLLRRSGRPRLPPWAPVVLDVLSWWVGAGLVLTVSPGRGVEAPIDGFGSLWLWGLVALGALEAARSAMLRSRAELRLTSYERLHQAHERILAESSGMGGIAEQILIECRNILPLQWFQFELPKAEGDMATSWAAGPDAHLVEGRPRPPQRPQMLPGIHRRATWRVLEQDLIQQTPEGEDEVLATLRLWCDPRRIDAGSEALLATLVPQMAASVHRARLDREARLDPLTGVPVRRVLEASLQRAYRRACDDGTPMAIIMCDIDFFKRVNDTWGHDAGDEALKLVASTLDATRRDSDLCCRYGGEEFTILLERTDGLAALQLAERLRRAVEALAFFYDGQSIPLTLSLGVAAFPELTIKTASELQLLADEALYEAKERGRNQSLLNVGKGAFLAPPGVPRQESSTTMARPVIQP
ncbi:MAG: GGDEF domain-containing protein [Acidobacteriota bacterium]